MKNLSEYEIKANEFLAVTKTEFKSEYLKFGKHFQDDRHPRNIFKITLINEKHSYSFNFGASLADSLENCSDLENNDFIDFYCGFKFAGLKREFLSYSDKIKISDIKKAGNNIDKLIDKKMAESIYNDFVSSNTTQYSKLNIVDFRNFLLRIERILTSSAIELRSKNWGEAKQSENIVHPTSYDVLSCLQKYDVGTFEDFCSEFGYDTDSVKALKTYKAVQDEFKNVQALFNDYEIELLQEIQ